MHGYKLCNRESVPKIIITPNFIFNTARAGFTRQGKLGSCPGPSQLGGYTKTVKKLLPNET